MNIVVIHGQKHKGSTWHITQMLLDKLTDDTKDILEFYTNDIPSCVGCFSCIMKDENLCPHRDIVGAIIEAIEKADVIIAESPNYCMGMSGQLKTLFDHFGYRWMSHRPYPTMKHKVGVAISTTAGMGAAGVTKDIKKNMFYWGISKIYRISNVVAAFSWESIKPEKKNKIATDIQKTSKKILKNIGRAKPGIKSKFMFKMFGLQQKGLSWNPVDKKYWEDNGWI